MGANGIIGRRITVRPHLVLFRLTALLGVRITALETKVREIDLEMVGHRSSNPSLAGNQVNQQQNPVELDPAKIHPDKPDQRRPTAIGRP
jgi:hypothetical protein